MGANASAVSIRGPGIEPPPYFRRTKGFPNGKTERGINALLKNNTGVNSSTIAEGLPDTEGPILFDQMKGFPEGRKERVMHVTEDEMASAMISLEHRDYCAHKLIDLHSCYQKNFPMNWRCHHERHVHHTCNYEDHMLRFKEYEREKRLMERQRKKESRAKRLAQQQG